MFIKRRIYDVCRDPVISLTLLVLCGLSWYYINSVFPTQTGMNSMWTGGLNIRNVYNKKIHFALKKVYRIPKLDEA